MLEEEGFAYDGYIDIFDGGPTMTARDRPDPHGPRGATGETVAADRRRRAATMMLADRPAARTSAPATRTVERMPTKGELLIDAKAAELLGVEVGDTVLAVAR